MGSHARDPRERNSFRGNVARAGARVAGNLIRGRNYRRAAAALNRIMRRARAVILPSGRMRLYGLTDRGGARKLPFPRTARRVSSSPAYASRNRDRARVLQCRPDGDGGRRTEKAKRHRNFNPTITRTRYSSSSRYVWLVSRHASVEQLVISTPRIARGVACRARSHACAYACACACVRGCARTLRNTSRSHVPSRCMKSGKLREARITGKPLSPRAYAAE
jgi:hypothetical protein